VRGARDAQTSIFENFSNHEYGVRLEKLSQVLDRQPAFVGGITVPPDAQSPGICAPILNAFNVG